MRDAWLSIDLAAIAHNVAVLTAHVAPAQFCAVVKADGYGHGAIQVAQAALDAGASMVAVALVDEGITLRCANIDAPILVLSEPPESAVDDLIANNLTPTVYRTGLVDALSRAAQHVGKNVAVHAMVDTGMRRVGVEPSDAGMLVRHIVEAPNVTMAGLCTHFAVADEPDNAFSATQIERFDAVCATLREQNLPTGMVHAANSAAAIRGIGIYDLVRVGISLYGFAPSKSLHGVIDLQPALSLHAHVSFVKTVGPGEGISYGLRYRPDRTTQIATVPLGYADGVRRELGTLGTHVLIGGMRCRVAGTITMDQLLVDCGPDANVAIGDEVVLLGKQGDDEITAQEWADLLDTITYEIVCDFGPRLPRRYTTSSGLH